MRLGCPVLRLSTFSREILVPAIDAIGLCRGGGYRPLSWSDARARVERLDARGRGAMRLFAARARVASSPLTLLDDHAVLDLVLAALRRRDLVMLAEQESAVPDDRSTQQRRLVKRLAAKTGGRLSHLGRRYQLVADADIATVPHRGTYEVVSHAEAGRVLQALARESGPELTELLVAAKQQLAPDWRPPFAPEGLVLLRRSHIIQSTRPNHEPAITPSQLKRLMQPSEELIDWCIWVELDPEDPKAQDDVLVLLDSCYQEVQRVKPITMSRSGDGVIVVFKQIGRDTRYTLVKDYGPDEGGGMDPLFIDSTPREVDERRKRSS